MASRPYQKLAIDERVKRTLRDTPLFDGHNDLPQQPRAVTHGKIYDQLKFDFGKGFERGMTDIPRLRDGDMAPSLDPNIRMSHNL
jgi:membrane dipeptidase